MRICAWDFFMKLRLIIHYTDGKTFTGKWNTYHPFKDLNTKQISSLQIQSLNSKYTLSSKRKQRSEFYSRQGDNSISILKELHRNIWIDLSIDKVTEKRSIRVIKERITNI